MTLLNKFFLTSCLLLIGYIAPVSAVTLGLSTNHVNFIAGNTLTLSATIAPTNDAGVSSDIYLVRVSPDNTELSLDNNNAWNTTLIPWKSAYALNAEQFSKFASWPLANNLAMGDYIFKLYAVPAGQDPHNSSLWLDSVSTTIHFQLANENCKGTNELPPEFANAFVETTDDNLIHAAVLGKDEGNLCQGKVYTSTKEITIYRAWNNTNSYSRLGQWWAFSLPHGKTKNYRTQYEICYQWSPIDTLTQCTLKAGTKIVVGTGQSALCSQYLTYPTSDAKQIYLDNASAAVSNCQDSDGVFRWKAQ